MFNPFGLVFLHSGKTSPSVGQQGPLCPRHLPPPLGGAAEASTNPVSWFLLLTNRLLPRVPVGWGPAPQQSSTGSSVL